jgi:hypothetical protein
MLAMQYRISLPADYDMGIIRRRIAERGHLTDALPQLAFKAYLHASGRENLYAPFYLWRDVEGMNAFIAGAGFAGVVASFGRPAVHTWSVWRAEMAPELSFARLASRVVVPIRADAALEALRDQETAIALADRKRGALAAISAFDPTHWTLLRFRLWRETGAPNTDHAELYEVGHISHP